MSCMPCMMTPRTFRQPLQVFAQLQRVWEYKGDLAWSLALTSVNNYEKTPVGSNLGMRRSKETQSNKDSTSTRPEESNRSRYRRSRSLADFAKYVPLRLSPEERTLLNVLEQSLNVSEYTDAIDISLARKGQKAKKIQDGVLEICHLATGLAVASGHERDFSNVGKKSAYSKLFRRGKNGKTTKADDQISATSWASREPKDNADFFQALFEVGRRNKVLNPSHMRSSHGKLMHILQDSQNPTVVKKLGFSLFSEIKLVVPFLEERQCLDLLQDSRLEGATQFIRDRDFTTGRRLGREEIERQVGEKHRLMEELVQEYAEGNEAVREEEVRRAIHSISDAISSVESNLNPVKNMLHFLEENFSPSRVQGDFSLELHGSSKSARIREYAKFGMSAYGSGGTEGPTLSHSHATQFVFVWQTLRLWCKVMKNMHKLWVYADKDLLSDTIQYNLVNTGQGLNRVQACPRVAKLMKYLLHTTQQEAGGPWVGLSVIHLGDRDVPNALVFIDKYTQIPRFLGPIVTFLQSIPELCEDKRISDYIDEQFGSQEKLKLTVLADFYRHAFDGSGDDGGSCIDGRLTSSWNWTSRLSKKSYYHVFMMSGFLGFDGDFK